MPAVELNMERSEHGDSFASAAILEQWVANAQAELPPHIRLDLYDKSWELIKERISLPLINGSGGLIPILLSYYEEILEQWPKKRNNKPVKKPI